MCLLIKISPFAFLRLLTALFRCILSLAAFPHLSLLSSALPLLHVIFVLDFFDRSALIHRWTHFPLSLITFPHPLI